MPVERSPVLIRNKPPTLHATADSVENQAERRPSHLVASASECGEVERGGVVTVPRNEKQGELQVGEAGIEDSGDEKATGMDRAISKPIGKLDESVFRPFGRGSVSSLSRSSSDTGSEEAICNGGLGKTCGNPVKEGEAGVLCDMCHEWYHAGCQSIPKPAIKALDKFQCLAWLCCSCKAQLKNRKSSASQIQSKSLELKVVQLEKALQGHAELVSSSMQLQEKMLMEQVTKVEKVMEKCEKYASDQVKAIDNTLQQQRASYADAVKGSCDDVAKAVQSQIALLPTSIREGSTKAALDLSRTLDDHLDKEKRKANLVIHNLPEQEGSTLTERSERDIALFTMMVKDVMKIRTSSSKSFRVGKKHDDRPRLLIVTLDNPACKQDILRNAPQLRNSAEYGNIYVTPDLTQKEREANRKLREELTARRRAGEANLTIRGGRIVHAAVRDQSAGGPASGAVGGDRRQHELAQPSSLQSEESTRGTGAPAILCSGGGGQSSHHTPAETRSNDAAEILGDVRGQQDQPEVQQAMEPAQEHGAHATLCSGGSGQPAGDTPAGTIQGVSAPVLSGDNRGQPDQPTIQRATEPLHEHGAPAILSSGGGGQPLQNETRVTSQDRGGPANLGSDDGRRPAQPHSQM